MVVAATIAMCAARSRPCRVREDSGAVELVTGSILELMASTVCSAVVVGASARSGTVAMRDGSRLLVAPAATLFAAAADKIGTYRAPLRRQALEFQDFVHSRFEDALILCDGCRRVVIGGGGTIDGTLLSKHEHPGPAACPAWCAGERHTFSSSLFQSSAHPLRAVSRRVRRRWHQAAQSRER